MNNFPSKHTLSKLKLKAFNLPALDAKIRQPKNMFRVLLGFPEKSVSNNVLVCLCELFGRFNAVLLIFRKKLFFNNLLLLGA
jgi:hypothetical protein